MLSKGDTKFMVRAFLVVKDVVGGLLLLTEARMNTRYIAWTAGIGAGGLFFQFSHLHLIRTSCS